MRKIFGICFMFISLHAEINYELGNGLQMGSLPLYLGGYFSLNYENKANNKKYSIDDLSMLGYGSYEKVSYMAEFEFHDLYSQSSIGDNTTIKRDTKLHTERLYADYEYNENYTFRAGRYNSSIGFWNLLPINVLRQTTSNPKTQDLFPNFTTGADIIYASYDNNAFKIDLMLQNNEDIDPTYDNYNIDKLYGLGAIYEKYNYSIKFNAGYFQTTNTLNDNLYYFLLSAKYDTDDYEISSEVGRQESKDRITKPYSGYLQGVYHFTPKHSGIIRLETYEDKLQNTSDTFSVFGYTYRPSYPVAIKSEYQVHTLNKENQFLFSVSVLF
jgi:hypothetical protein